MRREAGWPSPGATQVYMAMAAQFEKNLLDLQDEFLSKVLHELKTFLGFAANGDGGFTARQCAHLVRRLAELEREYKRRKSDLESGPG